MNKFRFLVLSALVLSFPCSLLAMEDEGGVARESKRTKLSSPLELSDIRSQESLPDISTLSLPFGGRYIRGSLPSPYADMKVWTCYPGEVIPISEKHLSALLKGEEGWWVEEPRLSYQTGLYVPSRAAQDYFKQHPQMEFFVYIDGHIMMPRAMEFFDSTADFVKWILGNSKGVSFVERTQDCWGRMQIILEPKKNASVRFPLKHIMYDCGTLIKNAEEPAAIADHF